MGGRCKFPNSWSSLKFSGALQWQVTRRGGRSERWRGRCFPGHTDPGLDGPAVAWGSKMLSVIGSLATCPRGPGCHLDHLVWFHSLAKTTPGQPLECAFQRAGKRKNGSRSSLFSWQGGEGDMNIPVTYLATEGPAANRFCRKNKPLLSIATRSDECWMPFGDPERQRGLTKLVIPSWPSLKRINTRPLPAGKRMF